MNKYDVEYNRLMRKMERGGSIDSYAFKIDTPTGAPTKLSYIQQLLVRTTNFKAWFGDWEKASRVYIESGKHSKVIDGLGLVEEVIEEKIVSEVGSDYDKNIYDVNNLSVDAPFLTFDYEDEVYYAYKNVSKVLDIYTLEPRVVYHGTRVEDEFYTFRTETRATGRPYAYFAYNKEYSQNFVKDDGTLYECFLNVRDPYWDINYTKHQEFEITLKEISNAFRSKAKALNIPYDFGTPNLGDLTKYSVWAFLSLDWAKDEKSKLPFWYILSTDLEGHFKSALKSNGYDGVMFGEEFKNITEQVSWFKRNMFTRAVVIFESNQVKLADGRNVDFFGTSDDIRYSDGGMINDKVLEVIQNYSNEAYKPYFMVGDVVVRVKDHLANWNNFERINMDDENAPSKFLSIVIADDFNNALLRKSNERVEEFEERNEDDYEDLIAREYIYSPKTDAKEIISDIDFYISKMQQGKRNFALGGNLEKQIMLPDTNSKYAHLKSVLQKQGFDIYPSIKENQMEKFEVGGTIKHEKGTTTDGKKGGYFEGRSHADGGIKAFNVSTNTPIEVEGGEVIITKKAVDDDDLKEFEGEMLTNREILSRINQGGGGVAFEDGGEIHSCNCSGNKFAYGGETIEDYEIIRRLQSSYETKENMKNHKIKYGHNLMRKMKQGGFI
jgi:hypothetical protein